MRQELNYNSERKAQMLQQVINHLHQIVQKTPDIPEEESLRKWALQAKPHECFSWNIKHFKIAGFQYLRMLFGADTIKPDIHVRRHVSKIIGREISEIESIVLLEEASKQVSYSVRVVDRYIWDLGARPTEHEYDETLLKNGIRGKYTERYAAGTNIIKLDPDVAVAFPNDKVVNEALRSILKEKNKEK